MKPNPNLPKSEQDKQLNWSDEKHKNKLRSWDAFATHNVNGDPGVYQNDTSISLESWHDDIHVLVGTGNSSGHMGDPAIAAVRPLHLLR